MLHDASACHPRGAIQRKQVNFFNHWNLKLWCSRLDDSVSISGGEQLDHMDSHQDGQPRAEA